MSGVLGGLLASRPSVAPASFELISTVSVVGTGTSSVTFSSIPTDYTHLQIRASVRNNYSSPTMGSFIRLGFDSTGANYAYHTLTGSGSAPTSAGTNGSVPTFSHTANMAPTGAFGSMILDILDYTNTGKFTTVRELIGYHSGSSNAIQLQSFLWKNISPVTNIQFVPVIGGYFEGTRFSLYGIKGS
jgi:hypothetical protein